MGRLFAVLESPVLTGIEVSWPVGAAVESWPQRVPDLYLGEPVVVARPLRRPGPVRSGGLRPAAEGALERPAADRPRAARATASPCCGRERKIRALLDSTHDGASPEEVRAQIVALGLEHHLVTPHTSLVAVDVTPSRPRGRGLEVGRRAQQPAARLGLRAAWGALPQTATPAPLHATITLVALVLAALTKARRTRRAKGSVEMSTLAIRAGRTDRRDQRFAWTGSRSSSCWASPRGTAARRRGSRRRRELAQRADPPGLAADAGRGRGRAALALGRHAPVARLLVPGWASTARPRRGQRPHAGLRPRPPDGHAAAGRARQRRDERPPRHALRLPARAARGRRVVVEGPDGRRAALPVESVARRRPHGRRHRRRPPPTRV